MVNSQVRSCQAQTALQAWAGHTSWKGPNVSRIKSPSAIIARCTDSSIMRFSAQKYRTNQSSWSVSLLHTAYTSTLLQKKRQTRFVTTASCAVSALINERDTWLREKWDQHDRAEYVCTISSQAPKQASCFIDDFNKLAWWCTISCFHFTYNQTKLWCWISYTQNQFLTVCIVIYNLIWVNRLSQD